MFREIRKYFSDFKVLKDNPLQYWGVQFINVLDCTAYFCLLTFITLYLTADVGFDNVGTGYVYTVFGIASGIALMTFAGPIVDWLGVKNALLVGIIGKVVSSLAIPLMVLKPFVFMGVNSKMVIVLMLMVLGVGNAIMQTIYQLANARFSSEKSRGASFNLWYLFMNVGAFLGGMSVDWFGAAGFGYNDLMIFCAVMNLLSLVIVPLMVRSDWREMKEKKKDSRNPWEIFTSVVVQETFWKLIVLVTLFVPVRACFLYMSAVMPKYWVQVIGPKAPIGLFNSINPALIVLGIILLVPIANKLNIFKMLTYGAMVSASSLFVLVLPWSWFSTDMATGYIAMTVISMIVLSIGETFWSPKLMHITEAVAPRNEVATYMGISTATWFIAKTIAGGMSGHMIDRWCPAGIGEKIKAGTVAFTDSPEMLWLILGVAAFVGPVIAIFIRGWLFKGVDFSKASDVEQH